MFSAIFFSSKPNEKILDLEHHQRRIFEWFLISVILASLFGCVLSLIQPSNFTVFTFSLLIGTLLIYWLQKRYYYYFVRVGLYFINFLIIFQSYISDSAYIATLLSLILIIASILLKTRELSVFIFIDALFILYMLFSGFFTFTNLTNLNGIALVNNITVLIPSMISAYFVGVVISRVLITTIEELRRQYEKLQETKDMLIQQEKIDSIRVLAGGVAHDFNNILVSIMGNLSLLGLNESGSAEVMRYIEEILQATKRARNLTQQLLLYTKKSTFKQEIISDLDNLIHETTNFSLRGRKSKAVYRFCESIGSIFGDRMKLAQVIQNLVINADDAYDSGGSIEIQLFNQKISSEYIADNRLIVSYNEEIKAGEYVIIEVKDYANGIPKEVISKIFDPYFTTKETGSGLGLSLSLSIIQQHGGYISVESELGKGTIFRIYLPRIDVVSQIEENLSFVKPDFSNLRFVILDDDESNLKVLETMLLECNGKVVSLKCSDQLGVHLKQSQQMPDIAIVDYIMPGSISGIECSQIIKDNWPQTKIILSSGYEKENIQGSLENIHGFLEKPYTFEELIKCIENVLKK